MMKGDYSRFTFRPERSYSAVLMQQGRVQLDADWNEAVAINERRRRAVLVDLIGRCAVSRLTPDAFRIVRDGHSFSIGPGRLYVDGLVAECFGQGQLSVDPVLGEVRRMDPIPYGRQPFVPEHTRLKKPHGLVYLDVWQRTVSSLEDPELIDPAVGNDTTVRVQTVWQVKVLPEVSDAQQDLDRLDPPAGRLSCGPARGGYRGLENRLYRVEIHDRGPIGDATFKWSRDNGSTAAAVTDIGSDLRTLVLRAPPEGIALEPGDLLEALDERHELGKRPGVFVKVEAWHPPTAVITEPLPDAALDARFRPRVRRWEGLAATSTKPLELEDGIEVSFGGSAFRTGDYWSFSARTEDRAIHVLDEAPPHGIHHHRCPLALIPVRGGIRDLRPRRRYGSRAGNRRGGP